MSELVGIVGATGSGKSTAIHPNKDIGIIGLNPKETIIIEVAGKPLPWKGWKKIYTPFKGKEGNYLAESNTDLIVKAMDYINDNRPEIKNIVLDDYQYCLSFEFMRKALVKEYAKFNEMAKHGFDVLDKGRLLRDNIKVFVLTHSDEVQKEFETVRKMKTLGKMLDSVVTLEGLFNVVLYTDVIWHEKEQKAEYRFATNRTNDYPSKSPIGMFDNIFIPNDLGFVSQKIDEYYNE